MNIVTIHKGLSNFKHPYKRLLNLIVTDTKLIMSTISQMTVSDNKSDDKTKIIKFVSCLGFETIIKKLLKYFLI